MAPLTRPEAKYIFDNTLGCRYGTTTQGAAYGFMDIEGAGESGGSVVPSPQVVMRWLQDPAAAEFEPRWNNRLWNTCGLIVALSAAGTVILVTEAGPTAERYRFDPDIARGDKYSFRKCNRLSSNAQIVATITYGDDLSLSVEETPDFAPPLQGAEVSEKTVKELYDAIKAEIGKLAK